MAGNSNIPCFLLSSLLCGVSGKNKGLFLRFLLSCSFWALLHLTPTLAQDNPQVNVFFNVSKQNVSASDLDKNLLNPTALNDAINALAEQDASFGYAFYRALSRGLAQRMRSAANDVALLKSLARKN